MLVGYIFIKKKNKKPTTQQFGEMKKKDTFYSVYL